jgi:hypothetical protein
LLASQGLGGQGWRDGIGDKELRVRLTGRDHIKVVLEDGEEFKDCYPFTDKGKGDRVGHVKISEILVCIFIKMSKHV